MPRPTWDVHVGCARKRTGSVAPAFRPLMGSLGIYWVKAKATRLPWCTPALDEAECQLSIDPHEDGSGIMRDSQTASPQTFRTGDGRFAYNLAANLAQVQG